MKPLNYSCVLFFFSALVILFPRDSECQTACLLSSTCEECVSASYSCSWCIQTDFKKARCDLKENLLAQGCREDLIEDPKGYLKILKNATVRDSTHNDPDAIQIQPQLVRIKTRPRQDHSIKMTFRAANNFPVDLYFLFDNSVSMNSSIQSLAKLADDIGQAIGVISSNFKMGYGVFQDKVILPFTDTSPQRLINPCLGTSYGRVNCTPPFEFRHLLSMTRDVTEFKNKIHLTMLSGNVDHPEGSLDAIMQVIACKKNIGWRKVSRKLLIFGSNGAFKTAGAGKLAGIVTPNDGFCHLSSENEYDYQLLQDYPSVSQITDAVDNNEMHIIFAVTHDQYDLFKKLKDRIPQSVVESFDQEGRGNNQNIKDIIEDKYKEIVSEVEIVHNNVDGVDIKISVNSDTCDTFSQGTNKCKAPHIIGKKIEFQVDIKVKECPKKKEDRIKKIILHPDFLKKDTMELDIEIICDCSCKNDSTHWEENSDLCFFGNGTLKCGVCDCNQDRFGQFCECDSSELDSLSSSCVRPGQNSTECSGVGTCECGVCHCDEGFSGPFCQCNDNACGTYQREVCGGARGRCICGECVCEEDFTGKSCECPTSNITCIQDGVLCNDQGICECGQCVCDKKYTGKFCQNCFICEKNPCDVEIFRACAQCALADSDSPDCPVLGCPEIQLVDTLEDFKVCSIKQSDGCFLRFKNVTMENSLILYVQRTKTCPHPVDIVPIIAGVIGGVVAIGLLLLVAWKLLTLFFDKIEYSKFQEEVKNCKWAQQDNPFFKGATTTYKNPMLDTSEPID